MCALQGRIPGAVELLKGIPLANLYGGPDDNDASVQGFRGVREFEDYMTKRRERVKARRTALGWAIVGEDVGSRLMGRPAG